MKTMYWASTIILSAFLLLSAYTYLFNKNTMDGVRALGFPDFFRVQLAVLKIAAAFMLLVPVIPFYCKEWAYAGVGLFLLTAIVAHIAHKDSFWLTVINLVFVALLIISRYSLQKIAP
jgi:hypothetical protein